MGPAIGVATFEAIITVEAQQVADGDMHKVLFFLFGKGGFPSAELLDTDEEEDGIQVGQGIAMQCILHIMADLEPFEIQLPFFHRGAKRRLSVRRQSGSCLYPIGANIRKSGVRDNRRRRDSRDSR